MNHFTRSWYELKFENTYIKGRGGEIEKIFCRIMQARYPYGDFTPVRPWGNQGDRKNDGYLESRRQLFQVYAPNTLKQSVTEVKMEEDFHEAIPYWHQYFDQWIFVHNADENGVPYFVLEKLLEFNTTQSNFHCTHWSASDVKREMFALTNEYDIATAIGSFAPSERIMVGLRFENIQRVLEHVATRPSPLTTDLAPIPYGKLDANGLGECARAFIGLGFQKANLVRQFFNNWHDPNYGDEMASAFHNRYVSLRDADMLPDDIFLELQKFVVGSNHVGAVEQTAALAVLAYFFEQCEIYERPRDGT